jgi:hypothetical protein
MAPAAVVFGAAAIVALAIVLRTNPRRPQRPGGRGRCCERSHRTSDGSIAFAEAPLSMLPPVATSADWTFLSNHGHVLVALARDPEATMREVAHHVGITERAVQLLVRDLEQAGYLQITRVGRRNRYTIATELPLRHPLERDTAIGDFLGLLSHHAVP